MNEKYWKIEYNQVDYGPYSDLNSTMSFIKHWGVYLSVTRDHHAIIVRAFNAEIDGYAVYSPIEETSYVTLVNWMHMMNNALKGLKIGQNASL